MTMKSSLSILFVALASTIVDAQGPVRLDSDDVYFQYRPAQKGTAGAVGLCGFSIRGNHNSRANPRVEWDLNIDELIAGTTRVAGISAGTFEVVGHDRKARSPVVELHNRWRAGIDSRAFDVAADDCGLRRGDRTCCARSSRNTTEEATEFALSDQ
jgi:hypothetical protein